MEEGLLMLSFRFQLLIAGRAWAEHSHSPPGGQEAERREEGERKGNGETMSTLIEAIPTSF